MTTLPVIQLADVSVVYDQQVAIESLSLSVFPHELMVLVGESGGGKTTVLRAISGLVKPTNGQITVNNLALNEENLRRIRLNMGNVLQQISLFPNMTIRQNLTLIPETKHMDKKLTNQLIRDLMDAAKLPMDYLNKYPNELSGGEQQRVGIIRAFGTRPALILMDEPFSALDPVSRTQLQDLTLAIHERFKSTILFVTHDMNEALKMGQRIGVIRNGHLLQLDTPDEIVRHPANDYVQSLFKTSEALKTENVYIQRLLLAGFGSKQPYEKLPVHQVTGDSLLGQNYQLLSRGYQLAVSANGQVRGYLNSESVLAFLATKSARR